MALSACQYCGGQNDAGAQFCSDCGKPLTKAAAARAAVAAGSGGGGAEGGGGGGLVSRTSGGAPGSGGGATADAACPLCGAAASTHGSGGLDRRLIPDRRADHSLILGLGFEMATELARLQRQHAATTIRRTGGDIRFLEDPLPSP